MSYYHVRSVKAPIYTGGYDIEHKWGLPGIHCPACDATWSNTGIAFPCVDLSALPDATKLEKAWVENDFDEFVRLREMVRPLLPPGAVIGTGTEFGPLVGAARGTFGSLNVIYPWIMLVRPEALAALTAEGLKGLKGCPTALRFCGKERPELLELQIEPHGRLHRDCIPPETPEPCPKCGRQGFKLPDEPILNLASLPTDRDLFRLANFTTVIVVTERFVDAVQRLGLEDVAFRELPAR